VFWLVEYCVANCRIVSHMSQQVSSERGNTFVSMIAKQVNTLTGSTYQVGPSCNCWVYRKYTAGWPHCQLPQNSQPYSTANTQQKLEIVIITWRLGITLQQLRLSYGWATAVGDRIFCQLASTCYMVQTLPSWRMASSEMLRRVALVRTDVSEELSAFFIRVTTIGELGTTLAVTSNGRLHTSQWHGA
jgi:hypothetical protein